MSLVTVMHALNYYSYTAILGQKPGDCKEIAFDDEGVVTRCNDIDLEDTYI